MGHSAEVPAMKCASKTTQGHTARLEPKTCAQCMPTDECPDNTMVQHKIGNSSRPTVRAWCCRMRAPCSSKPLQGCAWRAHQVMSSPNTAMTSAYTGTSAAMPSGCCVGSPLSSSSDSGRPHATEHCAAATRPARGHRRAHSSPAVACSQRLHDEPNTVKLTGVRCSPCYPLPKTYANQQQTTRDRDLRRRNAPCFGPPPRALVACSGVLAWG